MKTPREIIMELKSKCPICNAPLRELNGKVYCINEDCDYYNNPIIMDLDFDKTIKPMRTAKELAYKAYLDAFKTIGTVTDESLIKERFENWWSQNVWIKEHRDCFEPELNVFIGGKRYIQAE